MRQILWSAAACTTVSVGRSVQAAPWLTGQCTLRAPTPLADAAPNSRQKSLETQVLPAGEEGNRPYTPLTMDALNDSQPATVALALVAGYVLLGVAVYHSSTAWSWVQSFYFVVVTLTSVGYGDLVPEGEALRLFTSAYIILGVGIIGTALGEVVSSLLDLDSTPSGRFIGWIAGAKPNIPRSGAQAKDLTSESPAEAAMSVMVES